MQQKSGAAGVGAGLAKGRVHPAVTFEVIARRRLRVGIVLDAIYPYHLGGREILNSECSTRLVRRGHSVRVFTSHWWPERKREIVRDGVALHAIGPRVRMYTPGGRRSIWQAVVFGLSSIRLLWAPEFDVLDVDQFPFSHVFMARLVCTLRRKPMTARWYEVWDRLYWKEYIGWLWPMGVFLQWATARCADLIFADSALTARRLALWAGVDPDRILVLPLAGIESFQSPSAEPSSPLTADLPPPLAGEPKTSGSRDVPRGQPMTSGSRDFPRGQGQGGRLNKSVDCIFIGRLLPHKHVDVLLRALALLPPVTGLIVGAGPECERLAALTRELGLGERVRFESPDTHDAAIDRLRRARLLVSLSTREGFGITVFEANACGVPALVVLHPDNASTELINDGVNGLITSLDPVAVADRIKAYLADPDAQARMSHAALAAATTYSWENYVTRIETAFETLIQPSPSRLEKVA